MPLAWALAVAAFDGGWLAWHLLAQTTTSTPVDAYVPLLNFGGFGVMVYFILSGRMVAKTQYDQALTDRDRDHGELVALRQKLEDVIIPGFIRMTDLSQRMLDREREERRGMLDRDVEERREMLDRGVNERRERDSRKGP